MVVTGHSGYGKSTVIAALAARGFSILADDVAAITQGPDGRWLLHPGVPHLNLWKDAVARLGLDTDALGRTREGIEKYRVPLQVQFCARPVEVAHVVVLGVANAETIAVDRLAGTTAFAAIRNQTRNLRVVDGLEMGVPHFQAATALAAAVPVTRIMRPRGRESLDEIVAILAPLLEP
jgi:hypothetical protein